MVSRKEGTEHEKAVVRFFERNGIRARMDATSGGMWHRKGDVYAEGFLIECKSTKAASRKITRELWEKTTRRAQREDKTPMLCFRVGNPPWLYFVVPEGWYMERRPSWWIRDAWVTDKVEVGMRTPKVCYWKPTIFGVYVVTGTQLLILLKNRKEQVDGRDSTGDTDTPD